MPISSPPAIQRAFLTRLEEARPRLAVPIVVLRQSDEALTFRFGNAARALETALLTRGESVVAAEWDGECWDFLLCAEVDVQSVAGGYVCGECKPEKRMLFPTREALWCDHLFEPLLRWVNDELAPARFLALWTRGGATWATLVGTDGSRPGDSAPHALLPLHGEVPPPSCGPKVNGKLDAPDDAIDSVRSPSRAG